MIYAVLLTVVLLLLIFFYYQNNKIDVTVYNEHSHAVSRSIKIAHLSDFHSKPFKKVLDLLEEAKPDYIMITGDYINDHGKNKEKMLEYGKKLVKIAPVYYITGNHERRLENFPQLMEELKQTGFTVLLNEISQNEDFAVLGLDEDQADFDDYKARKNGTFVYKDMSSFFQRLENCQGYKIVLSHFPENFEKIKELNYSCWDFDLQLSGHAHGGQWSLPFIGPVFSPGQGFRPKYARGIFGERPRLIVSRGLGNSEFPIRLFNHPEIVMIQIHVSASSNNTC